MKLSRLAPTALLFASLLLSSAQADEYQDAVSKAFPGFHILGPAEIGLDKDEMDRDVYAQVKDRPGLIVGRFNSDALADFAALIRGSKLMHIPEDKANRVTALDYYQGYLVVCLGRAQGGYGCTKMKTDPMRILKPHHEYLMKIPPGRESCTSIQKYKAPKPKRNPNLGGEWSGGREDPGEITFDTDAIGLRGSGGVVYVSQPRGMYIECGTSG